MVMINIIARTLHYTGQDSKDTDCLKIMEEIVMAVVGNRRKGRDDQYELDTDRLFEATVRWSLDQFEKPME